MKAITISQYGPPEVLQLRELPVPVPKANEVLVKIHAASVNPLDWHFMRGTPKIMRLSMGMKRPKCEILGADLAGEVVAVGSSVTRFKPGDLVFGDASMPGLGAFAEYVCTLPENLALKPSNLTFAESAAIPVAALTALQSLQKAGDCKGKRLLVNGASGGVGLFTVQLAKAMGAEVTGVCSGRNADLVKSVGADHVIDYTRQDFTKSISHYDRIIDNVGNRTVAELKQALQWNGKCIVVGYTSFGLLLNHGIVGGITSREKGKSVKLMGTAQVNQNDLETLKAMAESGKIKPVIDRQYPLEDTAAAISYLESGHARAKVVINVAMNK